MLETLRFFDTSIQAWLIHWINLILPAFDEFIISYKNRTAILPSKHLERTISANGIFWPVILLNGQVIGKWKRTIKKDKALIEIELFQPQNKTVRTRIEKASEEISRFLNKETVVNYKSKIVV